MVDNGFGTFAWHNSTTPVNDVSVYPRKFDPDVFGNATQYVAKHGSMSSDGLLYAVLETDQSASPFVTFRLDPMSFQANGESIVTSQRQWRAPVIGLPVGTVILHITVLTTTFDPWLENGYDEFGVVLVTETPQASGTAYSMTYFRLIDPIPLNSTITGLPSMERFTATLSPQASFRFEATSAMVTAISSQNGYSVAVQFADETVRSFVLDKTKSFWVEVQATQVTFRNPGQTGSPISLSDGGTAMAGATLGAVQTFASHVPVCASDQVAFRLALSLDSSPDQVTWRVFRRDGSNTITIADCQQCYGASAFQSVSISRDTCVSRTDIPCIGLEISANFTFPTHGFAAYVIDGPSVTLFASDGGRALDKTVEYSNQGATSVQCPYGGN